MLRARDRCIVCGGQRVEEMYYPANAPGPVAKCSECGFVFIPVAEDERSLIDKGTTLAASEEHLTSSNLDDLVGCWEFNALPAKLDEAPALRANARDALSRIAQYRQPPGRLLDFGCGWGFFLGVAHELGWTIHGLEPLPGHAAYARSAFGADVTTSVLFEDTFPNDYFDVVTSFQVFEHLPDPAGDIDRLCQAMRENGLILIEVPNIDTWSVRLLGKRHRHYVRDHLNFFSPKTLTQLLERKGFEILEVYFPTRAMSIRHLTTAWGGRLLPQQLVTTVSRTLERIGAWEKTIRLNVGDILAVIARKRT